MRAASLLGASLIAVLTCAAAPARGQGSAPPTSDDAPAEEAAGPDAEKLFFEGRDLYVAKDYEGALPLFKQSYAAQPSPNSHLFVARCLRELGRSAEAYEVYGEVMVESASEEKYARTHQAAGAERQELEAKVGRILLVPGTAKAASVTVGGRDIAASAQSRPIVVDAGQVSVQADVGGDAPFEWSGNVPAGETVRVELAPETGDEDPTPGGPGFFDHPLAPFAIGSGALAVAGFVTWGIMGSASASTHDDLTAECDGRCPPEKQDDVDSGRTQGTVSVIGFVAGLVGLAGAGALTTFILLDDDQDGGVEVGDTPLRVAPSARGADVGGISLIGAF